MFRFLLLALAIWLAFNIARQLLRGDRQESPRRRLPDRHMVRCAHCGLHVPEDEAVRDGDACYCSEKHRRAGKS